MLKSFLTGFSLFDPFLIFERSSEAIPTVCGSFSLLTGFFSLVITFCSTLSSFFLSSFQFLSPSVFLSFCHPQTLILYLSPYRSFSHSHFLSVTFSVYSLNRQSISSLSFLFQCLSLYNCLNVSLFVSFSYSISLSYSLAFFFCSSSPYFLLRR